MSEFPKTGHNQIRRLLKRGAYDKKIVYAVVDAALICHVGLIEDGRPIVIPTIHARDGDNILLHGASTSRLLTHVAEGHDVCITVTHVDGLVLARSVFHHSMNYRSAVLFGKGQLLEETDEKMRALEIFTEKLILGHWQDARQPTPIEMKATKVVSIPIDTASAKVRVGPPSDDEEDYALDIWAGVLPIHTVLGNIETDPLLKERVAMPDYVRSFADNFSN